MSVEKYKSLQNFFCSSKGNDDVHDDDDEVKEIDKKKNKLIFSFKDLVECSNSDENEEFIIEDINADEDSKSSEFNILK